MYPEGEEILVVDDDSRRRDLIVRTLRDEGFAVTAVAEGLAALRAVARQRFALIVAASHLPGMLDGLTTVRQARARQTGIKSLFIAEAACMPRWGDPGCGDVIAAPFLRWELLGCVFEQLQRDGDPASVDLVRRCRVELRA